MHNIGEPSELRTFLSIGYLFIIGVGKAYRPTATFLIVMTEEKPELHVVSKAKYK